MATQYRDDEYGDDFDIPSYLETFYLSNREITKSNVRFRFDVLHKTFGQVKFTGPRMLELGGGPSVLNVILACERFSEITFSDFSKPFLQTIEKWVNNEPDAMDWSQVIRDVCDMEGNKDKWQERQVEARQSIKEIIHCDVRKSNPLEPYICEPFDAIMSSFCLQAACPNKESFLNALKNITSLLKMGGILLLLSPINASYYLVDDKVFYCLVIDEEFISTAVIEAGYRVVSSTVNQSRSVATGGKQIDSEGVLFLAAVKL